MRTIVMQGDVPLATTWPLQDAANANVAIPLTTAADILRVDALLLTSAWLPVWTSPRATTITDAANGLVTVHWQNGDFAQNGTYYLFFRLMYLTGEQETLPTPVEITVRDLPLIGGLPSVPAGVNPPDALVRNLSISGTVGFSGHAPVSQQAVTGALSTVTDPAAKAVLQSLLAALVATGLLSNGTT